MPDGRWITSSPAGQGRRFLAMTATVQLYRVMRQRQRARSALARPPCLTGQNLMRRPAVGLIVWVAWKPFARPPYTFEIITPA